MSTRTVDEILSRIAFLEKSMKELHAHLAAAAGDAEQKPGTAMRTTRVALQAIVSRAFERLVGEPVGERSLSSMINHDRFEERVPRRIIARMNSVRSMCNIPAHKFGEVRPSDALDVLRDLCEIVEWYMEAVEAPREGGEPTAADEIEWDRDHPALGLAVKLIDRFRYYAHQRNAIHRALEDEFGWGGMALTLAYLALNELVDNAFEYGCHDHGEKEVRIGLEMEGDRLTVTVTDQGEGFNLEKVLAAAREADVRRERGRGLPFIKRIATDLVAADEGRTVRAVLDRDVLESYADVAEADRSSQDEAGPELEARAEELEAVLLDEPEAEVEALEAVTVDEAEAEVEALEAVTVDEAEVLEASPGSPEPPELAAAGFRPVAPDEIFASPRLPELLTELHGGAQPAIVAPAPAGYPTTVECHRCRTALDIPSAGKYECPCCRSVCVAEPSGRARFFTRKEPPPAQPPSHRPAIDAGPDAAAGVGGGAGLHFRCPCGAVLEAAGDASGRAGECPACGKIVVVPGDAVVVGAGSPAQRPASPEAERRHIEAGEVTEETLVELGPGPEGAPGRVPVAQVYARSIGDLRMMVEAAKAADSALDEMFDEDFDRELDKELGKELDEALEPEAGGPAPSTPGPQARAHKIVLAAVRPGAETAVASALSEVLEVPMVVAVGLVAGVPVSFLGDLGGEQARAVVDAMSNVRGAGGSLVASAASGGSLREASWSEPPRVAGKPLDAYLPGSEAAGARPSPPRATGDELLRQLDAALDPEPPAGSQESAGDAAPGGGKGRKARGQAKRRQPRKKKGRKRKKRKKKEEKEGEKKEKPDADGASPAGPDGRDG